jgi:hypothetical protein
MPKFRMGLEGVSQDLGFGIRGQAGAAVFPAG